jgi:hypothetical protein
VVTSLIEDEPRLYRIGRYEILGPLATGGMAEILLARLVGPSGFERIVVLKRILPHFASSSAFVKMFLDEARIAAAIRHANVVDVHELGHEGSELYLAMEYLEGESLAGLQRRLRARGERLPPAIAAYVVAAACAGLHAAHELNDAEGRPLELVHRDVSPQNLFVGYDGSVKVLDFGIALARDRLTETETGALKGKIGYMSPEQVAAEPLDRRSDVFALGIVLYECLTARRLFRRESQVETIRAIAEQPIQRPTTIDPDVPPALEAVAMRALERDRVQRYASAADMRRALIDAMRVVDPERIPQDALAEIMQRAFPERMHEKSAMLSRVRAGSAPVALPVADVDVDIEIPVVEAATVTEPRPRAPRRTGIAIAITLVSVALAGILAANLGPPPSSVAPVVVPETIRASIVTTPPGATVRIDGELVGATPWEGPLVSRTNTRVVSLVHEGYATRETRVAGDRDLTLRETLDAIPIAELPDASAFEPPPTRLPASHRRTPRERRFRKFE